MAQVAIAAVLLLVVPSCRKSAADYAPGPGRAPASPPTVTAAPASILPVESSDAPVDPKPPQDEPAKSAESLNAPDEEGGNGADSPQPESEASAGTGDGAAMARANADGQTASADKPKDEYPLQQNPLSGCPICHVDVEDEFVGSMHFQEKVGCITCHGPSQRHLADENNEVKPDQLFARADVGRLCARCHECSRPKPEKPELTEDGQRKVCIDCHGSHDVVLAADAGVPTQ